MFYKLLGMAVWKGAIMFFRARYGKFVAPAAGGAALLAVAGIAAAVLLGRDDDD